MSRTGCVEIDAQEAARRVRAILKRIRYKDFNFEVAECNGIVCLRVEFLGPHPETGILRNYCGRWFPIMQHQDPADQAEDTAAWLTLNSDETTDLIVRTAFLAVREVEEARLTKFFRFDGDAIYDTARSTQSLMLAAAVDFAAGKQVA